ncbi:LPS export ABC transporter periplasmic protein LptC [Belliella sp. DSM 111904]|uniref:LPS export ABC transporter periplasmic protein LptC n=1 Tax=Belliella filtrata TaxID=2923435 RepID=A0ABS9UVH1_9BACT|nr:LPS export ABC transporter periplasmic protein LptC [Belliella filtrata]MCH7407798.1 LPS export ABC transporter periplasmic protein LptC [Belliella filtrata]
MTKLQVVFIFLVFFILTACGGEEDTSFLESYLGPTSIAYDVDLSHSDSTVIKINLKAKRQLEFSNGDNEFPDGIEIYFYSKEGELTTTIRADRGYYIRKEDIYRGEGDVQVENLEKQQKLASEELFWNPTKKKIYTEKFVTIQDPQRLIKGTGMEADESFSEYEIYSVIDSRTIIPGEGN